KPRRATDVRQGWTFTAGWTACHVGRAAGAELARVTYFDAVGPSGLVSGEGVLPVYHALADAAETTGAEVLAGRSTAPLRVDAMALRVAGGRRLLLANLTRTPQSVRLPPSLVGGSVRRLNQSTAADATRDPAGFRAERPAERADATLELGPHAYVRID